MEVAIMAVRIGALAIWLVVLFREFRDPHPFSRLREMAIIASVVAFEIALLVGALAVLEVVEPAVATMVYNVAAGAVGTVGIGLLWDPD